MPSCMECVCKAQWRAAVIRMPSHCVQLLQRYSITPHSTLPVHHAEEAICVHILLLGLLFSLGYGIYMQIFGATSLLMTVLEWRH